MLEERAAKIESDVEHLKKDVEHLRTDVHGLRSEFSAFKVDVTREFGTIRAEMARGFGRVDTSIETLRTAMEHTKRWTLVTGLGVIASGSATVAAVGRMMKWF